MVIRIMQPRDYDEVYALWLRTPGMGLNSVDDSRDGIEKYLRRNPDTCFVAEEDGAIIGAILAGHDGRRGHISHTAVDERFRLRGIGRALVERAMEAFAHAGIVKATLVAFARNEVGNAFWERMGFARREDLAYRDKAVSASERIDT